MKKVYRPLAGTVVTIDKDLGIADDEMVAGMSEQEGMGSKIFPFFVEFYWNFSWKCDYLIYWYDKEIILMIIFQIVRLLIFCDNKELCISNHQIPFIGLRNQSTWAQSNSPTHFELP